MLFLCSRQVGTAPAAVCPQPMAKRAVNPEFILSRLRCLGITRIRVVIVRRASRSHGHQQDATDRRQNKPAPLNTRNRKFRRDSLTSRRGQIHEFTVREFAEFYAKQLRSSLWKSGPQLEDRFGTLPAVHDRRVSGTGTEGSLHLRFPDLKADHLVRGELLSVDR